MLSKLSIRNYALIDQLEVNPSEGLNIITGETGAGKSIILGALGLIMGQRAESKYFYNDTKKCVIEGHFRIEGYPLEDFFEANDLDYEAETIIRREISPDGKSRAFVNDTPITLNNLKVLSEKLIDIHAQHATLSIAEEAFQLFTLDAVANNRKIKEAYEAVYREHREVSSRLAALEGSQKQAEQEADYHQFLYDELIQAKLIPDEEQLLEAEQNQLSHAEEIKKGLLGAHYQLNEQEPSAVQLLKEALQQVEQSSRYQTSLNELTQRLQAAYIEVKDIADDLNYKGEAMVFDQERLNYINERLSLLYSLQQKHHAEGSNDLLEIQRDLEQKLSDISGHADDIQRLSDKKQQLLDQSLSLALKLSKSRQAVIAQVEQTVTGVLQEVGIPNARFLVSLTESEQLKRSGKDEVQFLFSANKGMEPKPTGKVASGGELSRLMLAIKSLIAAHTALPTIIFDEIDTGISGEVALRVGEIMERMAGRMQVFAITHLPQIASKGNQHYQVFKEDKEGSTHTQLRMLEGEERILEVARMLSGDQPGKAAMEHAKILLKRDF